MKKRRSIVYVNFAPYDNAGRILDYLIDNFHIVVHFSYDHLRLKNGRRSQLSVYKNKELILRKNLIWLRTHPFLLFPSLPFVALAICFQTIWYVWKLHKRFGKFHLYLTVNAFTAWIGNLIKKFGFVQKTTFWVWDYFPVDFPDWRLRVARWVYLQFDKPGILKSNKVVFLNGKLEDVRRELGIISKKARYLIVPIGTNPTKTIRSRRKKIIGHLGMLKSGQGLDLLFNTLPEVHKKEKVHIEVIGSGPHEVHFKKRAKQYNNNIVTFYGYVEKDDDVDKIMSYWKIGLATYKPDRSSEHYWTDPSKIKAYINQGVPVITTNVPEFAKEIKRYKAGIIVDYHKQEEFTNAVYKLLKFNKLYSTNALRLARKYYYKNLYAKLVE